MDARFGNLIESIFGVSVVDDAENAVVLGTLIRVTSVEAPAFEESLLGCIAIVIARGGRTIAKVGVRLANHFAVLASCFEPVDIILERLSVIIMKAVVTVRLDSEVVLVAKNQRAIGPAVVARILQDCQRVQHDGRVVLALYLKSQFFGRAGTHLVFMMVTFITGQGHGQATESTAKLRGEYDLIAPNPAGLEEKVEA